MGEATADGEGEATGEARAEAEAEARAEALLLRNDDDGKRRAIKSNGVVGTL